MSLDDLFTIACENREFNKARLLYYMGARILMIDIKGDLRPYHIVESGLYFELVNDMIRDNKFKVLVEGFRGRTRTDDY